MHLTTNRFLVLSGGVLLISLIAYNFWLDLGLTSDDLLPLISAVILSYFISTIGLIYGIFERKKGLERAIIGLIGNGLLVFLYTTILILVFTSG